MAGIRFQVSGFRFQVSGFRDGRNGRNGRNDRNDRNDGNDGNDGNDKDGPRRLVRTADEKAMAARPGLVMDVFAVEAGLSFRGGTAEAGLAQEHRF